MEPMRLKQQAVHIIPVGGKQHHDSFCVLCVSMSLMFTPLGLTMSLKIKFSNYLWSDEWHYEVIMEFKGQLAYGQML